MQLIAAADKEDLEELWELLKTKIIKYPADVYRKTPVGLGLEKLARLSSNELFKRGHDEQKNSNDKYPANESNVIFWCTNT